MNREPHIPETKNAISLEMRAELIELFRKIGDDASVKVVVLTESGNAFCSGGDIRNMEGIAAIPARIRLKKGQRLIKAALGRWPASLETFLEMESTVRAVAFSSEGFDEG